MNTELCTKEALERLDKGNIVDAVSGIFNFMIREIRNEVLTSQDSSYDHVLLLLKQYNEEYLKVVTAVNKKYPGQLSEYGFRTICKEKIGITW